MPLIIKINLVNSISVFCHKPLFSERGFNLRDILNCGDTQYFISDLHIKLARWIRQQVINMSAVCLLLGRSVKSFRSVHVALLPQTVPKHNFLLKSTGVIKIISIDIYFWHQCILKQPLRIRLSHLQWRTNRMNISAVASGSNVYVCTNDQIYPIIVPPPH